MLEALRDTLHQLAADQVTDQVTDQVKSLLRVLTAGDMTLSEAMKKLVANAPAHLPEQLRPSCTENGAHRNDTTGRTA